MAKSTPFTLADLEAKGYVQSAPDVYERGPKPVKAKSVKREKERPIGLVAIENVLIAAGIAFERELVFSDKRRFRFDIAIPHLMIAVEYEGIFGGGKSRHTNVTGYTTDADKYNLAQAEGWKVLRYTAKNYKKFVDDIKQHI